LIREVKQIDPKTTQKALIMLNKTDKDLLSE